MATFIARQPIFDAETEVYGYELLHRSSAADGFGGGDPDRATVELLDNSLLLNTFEELTGGRLGFVNVPRNLLTQDFLQVLPPEKTVIEVLETVRPEPEVLRALAVLKDAGYRIALDDFVDAPEQAPLVDLADIVKVDWLATTRDERRALAERHHAPERMFLAEKVETRGQYEDAVDAGYDLFQGYFFCRPELRSQSALPTFQANHVRFLREISREDLSLEGLEEVIKGDMSLSARLLRYLNSAAFGTQGRIESIHHALVFLGERAIRRWGTLVALASMGDDKPLELVRTCLVRARFCEQAAERVGRQDAAMELYLTGLFSAIDAILDRPLDKALDDLGLPNAVTAAIQGEESEFSSTFDLAIACERGDVGSFRRLTGDLGLESEAVAELYTEALSWADGVFASGTESSEEDAGEGGGEVEDSAARDPEEA